MLETFRHGVGVVEAGDFSGQSFRFGAVAQAMVERGEREKGGRIFRAILAFRLLGLLYHAGIALFRQSEFPDTGICLRFQIVIKDTSRGWHLLDCFPFGVQQPKQLVEMMVVQQACDGFLGQFPIEFLGNSREQKHREDEQDRPHDEQP